MWEGFNIYSAEEDYVVCVRSGECEDCVLCEEWIV